LRVNVKVLQGRELEGISEDDLRRYGEYVTRLRQPSLRRVLSVKKDEDKLYLITPELPDGWNWIPQLPLPLDKETACSLLYSISRALDYLHTVRFRGTLQISPSEQFAVYRNSADLFLAVLPPEPLSIFYRGEYYGSPAYSPPEMGTASPASDSYGLVALLYLILTGETMISTAGGDSTEIIRRVQLGDFKPLSDCRPDLSRPLLDFFKRAVHRDPADRPSLNDWANRMRECGGRLLPQPYSANEEDNKNANRPDGELKITGFSGQGGASDLGKAELSFPAASRASGSEESADPASAPERRPLESVCFSVTAPETLRPDRSYVIDAWVHLRDQVEEILSLARQNQQFGEMFVRTKAGVRMRRGSLLTARLKIAGLFIDDPEDELPWNGDSANCSFLVTIPASTPFGDLLGQCSFHFEGIQVAKIPVLLRIGEAPVKLSVRTAESHPTAFASYSRKDTDEVLARVQGIQKALPQMDIFLDVASLRSGENWKEKLDAAIAQRDIFYLFWSKNARESQYVEREWRYALEVKGLEAINPVPLVSPLEAPPPPELAEKHFDDWVLAFMRGRA
jgi:hypothetical protein